MRKGRGERRLRQSASCARYKAAIGIDRSSLTLSLLFSPNHTKRGSPFLKTSPLSRSPPVPPHLRVIAHACCACPLPPIAPRHYSLPHKGRAEQSRVEEEAAPGKGPAVASPRLRLGACQPRGAATPLDPVLQANRASQSIAQ